MSSRKREPKFKIANRETEELQENHETLFRSALIAASRAVPFSAPAIRALTMVFSERVPTMAVDKYFRVYVNPGFLDACVEDAKAVSDQNPCATCGAQSHHPIAYVAGVICHEAWHPLREHYVRAAVQGLVSNRAYMLWNIAADMEINDDLVEVYKACQLPRICLPPSAYFPSTKELPEGKLAEEYYHLLLDKQEDHGVCKACGGTGKKQDQQDGDEQDNQSGQGEQQDGDGQDKQDGQQGSQAGQGGQQGDGEECPECNGTGNDGDVTDGAWNCGSGATGKPEDWEEGPPGEGNRTPGISEVEGRMVRKQVAKEIQEAAKNRGNMPGGWVRWADKELEPPKYDWRREMQKIVRYAVGRVPGDQLRTYRRLGRRSASIDFKAVLPSHQNPKPRVVIVQDTSGSMDEKAIKMSMSEAEGILRASGASIGFIAVDMKADKPQEAHNNIRSIDVHGGGGTDMRVGIKAAMESYPVPDIVVLFTDGHTPWPESPLPYGKQLIVGLVGDHACSVNEPPSWAHVIKIVGDDVVVRPKTER